LILLKKLFHEIWICLGNVTTQFLHEQGLLMR